jgi:signal transduction histidine kinase
MKWLGALLSAALVLAAVMTWRTIVAERERRAVAQRAIQAYAAMIAEELMRRTHFEFEYFGFAPVRQEIVDGVLRTGRVPSVSEVRAARFVRNREAESIPERVFLADFNTRTIEPPLPPDLQQWVVQHLERIALSRPRIGSEQILTLQLADGEHFLVYASAFLDDRRIPAFFVRNDALRELAGRALERRSPFPTIFEQTLTQRDLFFSISRSGHEMFKTPGRFDADRGKRLVMPSTFGPVLRAATVECSLSPRAVATLAPGGIPSSHPAASIAMLIATAGVFGALLIVARRARQLDRVRSDFVAGISHELRTPLTQIRMFAETLSLSRLRSESDRQRALEIIRRETARLTNLVENLLSFSQGERGELRVVRVEHDLCALVADAVNSFAGLAAAKQNTLRICAREPCVAPVDEDALKQIVLNLLDNAIRYGRRGQTVIVEVTPLDSFVRIAVDDEGPGIPAEERDRVWIKFYRMDRDRETHHTGSGIGLAVVQDLVEKHDGRYFVEGGSRGGARFVVELPV